MSSGSALADRRATAVFEIWREEEGRPHATPTDVVTEGVEPEAAPALLGEKR